MYRACLQRFRAISIPKHPEPGVSQAGIRFDHKRLLLPRRRRFQELARRLRPKRRLKVLSD